MDETNGGVNPSRWNCGLTLKRKGKSIALKQQHAMSQVGGKNKVRCR